MKGRMFSPEIRKSRNFSKLNMTLRDLFHGLIESCADDQGRMLADPHLIKAAVWTWDNITPEETQAYLDILAGGEHPFIHFYEAAGERYIQILKWWKWQGQMTFAAPSIYPAPFGWVDRIKIQTKGNKSRIENWDKSGGWPNNIPPTHEVNTDVQTEVYTQAHTLVNTPVLTEVIKKNKTKQNKQEEKENEINLNVDTPAVITDVDIWNEAKGILQREISKADFDAWIQPIVFLNRIKNEFVVLACNRMGRDWVRSRASPTLERILAGLVGEPVELVVSTKFEDLRQEAVR